MSEIFFLIKTNSIYNSEIINNEFNNNHIYNDTFS